MRPLKEYHADGEGVMPPKGHNREKYKGIVALGILLVALGVLALFCYGTACFFLNLFEIITK